MTGGPSRPPAGPEGDRPCGAAAEALPGDSPTGRGCPAAAATPPPEEERPGLGRAVTLKSVAVLPRSVSRTWSGSGPGSSARRPPPRPTPPLGPKPHSVKLSHSAAIFASTPASRETWHGPRAGAPLAGAAHRACAAVHGRRRGSGGKGRGRSGVSGRGAHERETWRRDLVRHYRAVVLRRVGTVPALPLPPGGVGRLCQLALAKDVKIRCVLNVLNSIKSKKSH